MDFRELLKNDEFIVLDGAMGTMLQKSGMKLGSIPEELNFTDPELIKNIHREYIKAGARAVYANTFGANSAKLAKSRFSTEEIIREGVKLAREAAGDKAFVGLDVGSLGRMLKPLGDLSVEEAYKMFAQIMKAGADADFVILETMTDLMEIKTALLAAKECTSVPVLCTMTFEKNMRTFTGCTPSAMALTLQGLGADAIGMNCSLGPDEAGEIADEIIKWAEIPVIIRPNAGLPDPKTGEYAITPEKYAEYIEKIAERGAKVFGGCCGTSPEFIKAVSEKLCGKKWKKPEPNVPAAVCSASKTVVIDTVRIIGERINPTGKKTLQQALKRRDLDYIMKQAAEQAEAGAEILDINVGLPDIDELDMMKAAVDAVQSVTELPLQIDSTEPEVIEAALRRIPGKAVVNSVNGEDEKLDAILPVVKKYGAAVIGLTLDKDGIPRSSQKRVEIAEKILKKCELYGIPRRDVYIDCLTLTASAEQEGAAQTLEAIRIIKEKYGLKTALGVSNISFGLPNRELVNKTFLTMAMNSGLDLPIMNPNTLAMTDAVMSFRLLSGYDKNGAAYIEYSAQTEQKRASAVPSAPAAREKLSRDIPADENPLAKPILSGLGAQCADIAKQLLEGGEEPMTLINERLIPALDEAGIRFEKGEMFLPQLIQAAGAAQCAFDAVKAEISKKGGQTEARGRIILATVKGDVHDIGKNIVKTLLENYGYEVIDLGKDVEPQLIADSAEKFSTRLVGLSALMTTTLKSMEATIKLIRQRNIPCKIVAGGAVLTEEYAKKIGADFYAKDAKATVDAAKTVFGA